MPKTEAELFAFLAELGIAVSTHRHPPLFTVADSQALRGEIAGGHTKNLFLKDKKDNFFLVTVDEDAVVDLKQIHHAHRRGQPRFLRQAGDADGASRRRRRARSPSSALINDTGAAGQARPRRGADGA